MHYYRKSFLLFLLTFPIFLTAQDYYFVAGDDGRWSNIQNWRTSSGGANQHSVVPSANDNIIIDENSFSGNNTELIVDLNIATCRDIQITTDIPFTLQVNQGNSLIISGNVEGRSTVDYKIDGQLNFNGSGTKIIDFGQNIQTHELYIGATGGEWTFVNDYYVEDLFRLTNGTITFQDLTIDAFTAVFEPTSELNGVFDNTEIILRSTEVEDPGFYSEYSLKWLNTDRIHLEATESIIRIEGDYPSILLRGNEAVQWDEIHFEVEQQAQINYQEEILNKIPELHLRSLKIKGNIKIDIPVHTDHTLLHSGTSIELKTGEKYVWEDMKAEGTCIAPISISSGEAEIHTQTTEITHAIFTNITFTGNAEGTDIALMGASSGIEVEESEPRTYFWINGAGDWNDENHWSLSSGGSPAGCIPSGEDNVVFDNQSFQNTNDHFHIPENAYVDNISWEISVTGPTLSLEKSANLFINGSMLMTEEKATFDNEGNIYFVAGTDAILDTKNSEIDGDIFFEGKGSWKMESDFTSQLNIHLNSGTLQLNGYQLTNNNFYSENERERTMDISGSHWIFTRQTSHMNSFPIIILNNFTLLSEGSHTFFRKNNSLSIRPGNNDTQQSVEFDSVTVMDDPWEFTHTEGSTIMKAKYVNLASNVKFQRKFEIEELILHQGRKYEFNRGTEFSAESVTVEIDCQEGMVLQAESEAEPAIFHFPDDTPIPGLTAQNIHVRSGNIIAHPGLDNGNNEGIDFGDGSGRTLYWVGGTGSWIDRDHWSHESGGDGGSCPPGPFDDVIFDQNSFTTADDYIHIPQNQLITCRNFTWKSNALGHTIRINDNHLQLNGSMTLEQKLETNFGSVAFSSSKEETHHFHQTYFYQFLWTGNGTHHFADDVEVARINYFGGKFNIDHSVLSVREITIDQSISHPITLNNAIIRFIDGPDRNSLNIHTTEDQIIFENIGESFIEFLGEENEVIATGDIDLGRIFMRNPSSNNRFQGHQDALIRTTILEITGNNTFENSWETDTLIVYPGHYLYFGRNAHVKVNQYHQYLGNNCLSSIWTNTDSGGSINFEVEDETVVLQDHIQMEGINASGSGNLAAGPHSIDVGRSNSGWFFEEKEPESDDEGILGSDLLFCGSMDTVILNENNIFGAESILWNESSTEFEYIVSTPGEYRVEISYANGCVLKDTLEINLMEDVGIDLGADTLMCEGDSLLLSPFSVPASGYDLQWNTGEKTPEILVKSSGTYQIDVIAGECEISDSIRVDFLPVPELDLLTLLDTSRCEGDPMTLDFTESDYSFIWQNEKVDTAITVDQSGRYTARLEAGDCYAEDEITITFHPSPEYHAPHPDPFCEGDSTKIMIESPDNQIEWEDGYTEFNRFLSADQSRFYHFKIFTENCTVTDSVQISVLENPITNLIYPKDGLCKDEKLKMEVSTTGERVVWDDGTADLERDIDEPGTYTVYGFLGSCTDSAEVIISAVEEIDPLLPPDTTVCEGESILLHTPVTELEDIRWNDRPGTHSESFSGSQTIDFEAKYQGCPISSTIQIISEPCGSSEIAMPNVFAPDGSDQNRAYKPIFESNISILEYRMDVFDRWGNVIFTSRDPESEWSGKGADGIVAIKLFVRYTNGNDRIHVFEETQDVLVLR